MTNGRRTRPLIRIPLTPRLRAALADFREKSAAVIAGGCNDGRQGAAAPREEEERKPGGGDAK